MSDFGGLIRDGRERLGLSTNRVAELIGRASGTVKAWERGRTIPSDPVVVTSLAAVLAIDEDDLFRAAGLTPPGVPPPTTIEQELASIAPAPSRPAAEPEPERERAAVVTDEQPTLASGRDDEGEGIVEEPDPITEFLARAAESVKGIRFPSFERWARRERTATRAPKVRAVPLQQPRVTSDQPRSYLEDSEERWSYRLRVIWTVAGLGAMGITLLWAGSRAFEALGDALDALLAGL